MGWASVAPHYGLWYTRPMSRNPKLQRPHLAPINAANLAAALQRWRQVAALHDGGMTYAEIGARLGITRAQAWKLHRKLKLYEAQSVPPTPAMVH